MRYIYNILPWLTLLGVSLLTGCASNYNPTPATTTMVSPYDNQSRQATCGQLQAKLVQLGYGNTDIVDMKDERAANTIIAYKANGCEK